MLVSRVRKRVQTQEAQDHFPKAVQKPIEAAKAGVELIGRSPGVGWSKADEQDKYRISCFPLRPVKGNCGRSWLQCGLAEVGRVICSSRFPAKSGDEGCGLGHPCSLGTRYVHSLLPRRLIHGGALCG